VVVRHPEMVDETFTFVAAAGRVETRALPLRERPLGPTEAFLTLTTEPGSARVRVGDRELPGASPYRVRVTAGQPVVVVATAPGHTSETRTLRPAAGQTVAVPTLHLSRERRPAAATNTAPPPGPRARGRSYPGAADGRLQPLVQRHHRRHEPRADAGGQPVAAARTAHHRVHQPRAGRADAHRPARPRAEPPRALHLSLSPTPSPSQPRERSVRLL
jgi:hypothetical protein